MLIETFDAIVVGAGPAGCAAAFDLAASGKRVAILERRTFPRVKPCGGALTIKALASLRFPIDPVVRNVASDFVTSRELTRQARFRSSHPVAVLTAREELDSFVLRQTLEIGAEFYRIEHLQAIDVLGEKVSVTADGRQFYARFLVGADGANSTVRRLAGLSGGQEFGFAIEGQVLDNSARQPSLTFDFGFVPRGYGWVFPRGDHYNVGIYTYDSRFRLFPEQLRSYVREKLGRVEVSKIVGAPIGMGGWLSSSQLRKERIFLAGDAAGLCEPVLGEGIYYAIKSGQIAARSILGELDQGKSACVEYDKGLRSVLSDLRIASALAMRFYRDLGIGCLALGLPPVRYALMKGYSVGVPLGDIPRELISFPFRKPPRLSIRAHTDCDG